MADLYPSKEPPAKTKPKSPAKLSEIYRYESADGALLYERVRYEPKDFRFRQPNGMPGLGAISQVLYRLPETIEAVKNGETIYWCEGEADANRLAAEGLAATTSGGCQSWQQEFAQHLAGATVVIIADADRPGRGFARKVEAGLDGVSAKVTVKQPPIDGDDISDHLDRGGTLETLVELDTMAEVLELVPELRSSIDEAFNEIYERRVEKYFARGEDFYGKLPQPDPLIEGVLALSSTAVLFGKYGTGKTYVALDIGLHVATGREFLGLYTVHAPVLFVAAERANQHEGRVKAWCQIYGEEKAPYNLGFYYPPTAYLDAGEDLIIARLAAEMGAKLIIIDTLRASMAGEENSSDDWNSYQEKINGIVEATGACVLVLHHPGKAASSGARGSSAMGGSIATMIEAKSGVGKTISLSDQGEHGKQAFFASGTLNHSWEFREAIVEINGKSLINAALVEIGRTEANDPNEAQHRTIAEAIKATDDGTGLTMADIERTLKRGGVDWSSSTVSRYIKKMSSEGIVKKVGTTRRWALNALLDDDDFDF